MHLNLDLKSPSRVFAGFLIAITAYRLLVLLQPHFGLFYDEAYYYHWALNPDFGYYSKPPMVAWSILLSTSILGSSVFAIKFMASILYGATSIVIYRTVSMLANSYSAALGGIIFLCIPLIGFNSEFITTDAPLLFFWSLALHYSLVSLNTLSIKHWFMLGIFTGFGMLSKYTMAALPLACFTFLAFSNKYRSLLLTPGPWLAAIVAGLIFSLNIYWNFQYDWIALQHTKEISHTSGELFNFKSLIEFLLIQLIIFGPVWSGLGIACIWKSKTTLDRETRNFLLFSVAIILSIISLQAFLSRAFANWAAPWMIGAVILLAIYIGTRWKKWLIAGVIVHLSLLAIFNHFPLYQQALNIELKYSNDMFRRIRGWPELGAELATIQKSYPDAILASDSRDLLAYLGYYSNPDKYELARWNPDENNVRDYYDLMNNLRTLQGETQQEFIFVSKKGMTPAMLSSFETAVDLGEIQHNVYKDKTIETRIYYLKHFTGYSK